LEFHDPAALSPRREPHFTHWIGNWIGPRAILDDVKKVLDPTGTRVPTLSVVPPLARRYIDYAILVPCFEGVSTDIVYIFLISLSRANLIFQINRLFSPIVC
jgi:hypothetical protein